MKGSTYLKLTGIFLLALICNSCKIKCECSPCDPEVNNLILLDTAILKSTAAGLDSVEVFHYDTATMTVMASYIISPDFRNGRAIIDLRDLRTPFQRLNAFVFRIKKEGLFDILVSDIDVAQIINASPTSTSIFHRDNTCNCACDEVELKSVKIDGVIYSAADSGLPFPAH